MIKIRHLKFNSVFNASGARGIFGEGYWFHKIFRPNWIGSSLVTKTLTRFPTKGNLKSHYMPKCIKVFPFSGTTVNAVGLTNPGISHFIKHGWPKINDPIVISISIADKKQLDSLIKDLEEDWFYPGDFAFEVNASCPNIDSCDMVKYQEICRELYPYAPIILKVAYDTNIKAGFINEYCDAINAINTVPWNKVYPFTNSPISPLMGGVSGPIILPYVKKWLAEKRSQLTVPIIAGGGVFTANNAIELLNMGADAISLGSVAIHRPWRVKNIIRAVKIKQKKHGAYSVMV